MSRTVLLDRDGTLVRDAGYTHRVKDYALLPGVVAGLRSLQGAGFRLVIVTNQSGIGRGYFHEADFLTFQDHLCRDLASKHVTIEASFHCPHRPDAGCDCRKPTPGLLQRASRELGFALDRAWMVGDAASDIGAAKAAGCAGSVLVLTGQGAREDGALDPSVPRARDMIGAAAIILAADS